MLKTSRLPFLFFMAIFTASYYSVAAQDYYVDDTNYADCCVQDNLSCCYPGRTSFEVDFLWWQLTQATSITTRTRTIEDGVELRIVEKIIYPEPNYDPGVRLALRHAFDCWCLDVGLNWTHLTTTKKTRFDAGANETFAIFDTVQSGRNHFKATLDYADFDFAKSLCCGACFTITPHIGVRGLWLGRSLRSAGTGVLSVSGDSVDAQLANKFRIWSYGIEGGLWMKWDIMCGWSLLGHAGGSILRVWGKENARGATIRTATGGTVTLDEIDKIFNNFDRSTITFDYFLGIQHERCICGYDASFRAGWEYFQIELIQYGYQGLTLGATLAF